MKLGTQTIAGGQHGAGVVSQSGTATLTGTIPLVGGTGGASIELGLVGSIDLLNALKSQLQGGRAKIVANPRIVTLNRRQAVITSGHLPAPTPASNAAP